MIVTLHARPDSTFVFANPGSQPGGITLQGTHSYLYNLSRRMNECGIRNGWTARVRVLIVGSRNPTDVQLEQACLIVRRSNFYHYEILVGDRRGIDDEVVTECNRLGATYRTFGTTVRPLNGGKHYTRIVVDRKASAQDRDAARLHWVLSEADIVYCLGVNLDDALLQGKDVVRL